MIRAVICLVHKIAYEQIERERISSEGTGSKRTIILRSGTHLPSHIAAR